MKKAILPNDAKLCLWSYHSTPGIIKLVEMGEDILFEKAAGRTHYDESLRETLLKGIISRSGSLRSLPIMPTSHMFVKLVFIGQQLFLLLEKKEREQRFFKYSDVFILLKGSIGGTTDLKDVEIEEMTKDVIHSGIKVRLFRDLTPDGEDISQKEFELSYSRRDYEKFETDYISNAALEKAFGPALEKFRAKTGYKTLNEYP
jgi:hypothetical protein